MGQRKVLAVHDFTVLSCYITDELKMALQAQTVLEAFKKYAQGPLFTNLYKSIGMSM